MGKLPAVRALITILISSVLCACGGQTGDSLNATTAERYQDVENEENLENEEHDDDTLDLSESDDSAQDDKIDKVAFFDWNTQNDARICNFLETRKLLTIGTEFTPGDTDKNLSALSELKELLQNNYSEAITIREELTKPRIATMAVEVNDCSVLSSIRALPQVKFVNPKHSLALPTGFVHLIIPSKPSPECGPGQTRVNPADYTPNTGSYSDYIARDCKYSDMNTPHIIRNHNIENIYSEGQFGSSEIGVAVTDNGILERDHGYIAQGQNFTATASYSPNIFNAILDGITPLITDFYSTAQIINYVLEHGTKQITNIYKTAPGITLRSVRSSPFVVWYEPSQYESVTNTILDLADDDEIRIISNSMATIFYIHEIERAIEYFNAKGKIFVSAAGTSPAPESANALFNALFKVAFPASLPSTIAATGTIHQSDEGQSLGASSWGGKQVDFTISPAESSSPATSHTAAIISLVWSANPSLSREEVIDILISSSYYYKKQGEKHRVFGWGDIDAYQAYLEAKSRL